MVSSERGSSSRAPRGARPGRLVGERRPGSESAAEGRFGESFDDKQTYPPVRASADSGAYLNLRLIGADNGSFPLSAVDYLLF